MSDIGIWVWIWVMNGLLVLRPVVDLEMGQGTGWGPKWDEVQYLGEG